MFVSQDEGNLYGFLGGFSEKLCRVLPGPSDSYDSKLRSLSLSQISILTKGGGAAFVIVITYPGQIW